jgi:hypothetical protein
MFGLTQGELARFSSALLTDAQQLAAQGDRSVHTTSISQLYIRQALQFTCTPVVGTDTYAHSFELYNE